MQNPTTTTTDEREREHARKLAEAEKLLDKPLTNRAFLLGVAHLAQTLERETSIDVDLDDQHESLCVAFVRSFKSVARTLMPTIQFLDAHERAKAAEREKEIEKFNDSLSND